MEIKEWRCFAVCSFLLFLMVVFICVPLPAKGSKKSSKEVQAHVEEKVTGGGDSPGISSFSAKEVKTAKETVWTTIEQEEKNYIKVPKQDGIAGTKVYLQEDYMSSKIVLNFTGDSSITYDASAIIRSFHGKEYVGEIGKKERITDITNRENEVEGGKRLRIVFTMKQIFDCVLYETEQAYYITLANPKSVYDHIIVLDAGHGGNDEGTMSVDKQYYEKDYVLSLVKELRSMFEGRKIKIYCTRTEDEYVTKKARVKLANKLHADLFVSIHCNAMNPGERQIGGLEALYTKRKLKYGSLSSKELAEIMLEELHQSTSLEKRGTIQREGLYLMRHAKVPVSIVEVGYMTNSSDMKFMKTREGQELILKGLYKGILKALGSGL